MALFESMLALAFLAIVMLQVSRGLDIPYPTVLAIAGVLIAALPWAPHVAIDPRLALTLFIAPALLDSAYDMPLRTLKRYWLSLITLAALAVVVTTAAVAWLGVVWAGLPVAVAIALGAIVAPPDAAAAAAMLSRLSLPRSTVKVLTAESLLNDAVALLIFAAAVAAAQAPAGASAVSPMLALAVPGGLVAGYLLGRLYMSQAPRLAGTLGGTLFEFVALFSVWIIADRLRLSAILAVVTFAMTIARYMPERQSARNRVHSYAVWAAVVFFLNVLAFLLLGLQARSIVARLDTTTLWRAIAFASVVLAVVIGVRVILALAYNRLVNYFDIRAGGAPPPTLAQGLVASWCGMRGLVTLATALALPERFPSRDLIVLAAFGVVIGTLVLQGLTLGPLIRRLRFAPDGSLEREITAARMKLTDAALASLSGYDDQLAGPLRGEYLAARSLMERGLQPRNASTLDRLRRESIAAKRACLLILRNSGNIEDDVFHALESELDWAELAATPDEQHEIEES
jgi:monovalent cation/hydrogen antiporter